MLNLFERKTGKQLTPRVYNNGVSQREIIDDAIKTFDSGEKIVLVIGGPGAGKSVIGLEVARHYGSGYITVPRKANQNQYRDDYGSEDSRVYIVDARQSEMPINLLKGKGNFKCIHNEFNPNEKPLSKFCDYTGHVCNSDGSGVSKLDGCPHYVINTQELPKEFDGEVKEYESMMGNTRYLISNHENICPYFRQMYDILHHDIVIINDKKFTIEKKLERLPHKKVLIIDECDMFLTNLTSPRVVNLSRLVDAVRSRRAETGKEVFDKVGDVLEKLDRLIVKTTGDQSRYMTKPYTDKKDGTFALTDDNQVVTLVKELFSLFADNSSLGNHKTMKSYYNQLAFLDFPLEETNVFFDLSRGDLKLNYFSLNAKAMVSRMFAGFDHVLMMSATIQSDDVLETFFGLGKVPRINAASRINGRLLNVKTGHEIPFRQPRMPYGTPRAELEAIRMEQRRKELVATGGLLDHTQRYKKYIKRSPPNTLFHIQSFAKLPKENELSLHKGLELLGVNEEKTPMQEDEDMIKFKKGEISFIKSTKLDRGIDCPDEQCRVNILQKLPFGVPTHYHYAMNRHIRDGFLWVYLWDECDRNIIQAVSRGLRHKGDYCFVLSPDSRVYERINKIYAGDPNMRLGMLKLDE